MILRLLLVSVVVALATALPDTTQATSFDEIKKLLPPEGTAGEFGHSVAVSGSTAVVGALYTDAGAAKQVGAAYVFQRDEGSQDNWGEVTKLTASVAGNRDCFGVSVAVSGDDGLLRR